MNVSEQVEQPSESDTSFSRFATASHNPLVLRYGCQDVFLRRLYSLDVCWLAFWFERGVYVVPRLMTLGFGRVRMSSAQRPRA